MTGQPDADPAQLREAIERDFGVRAVSLVRAVGGADAAAQVWRLQDEDGGQYAVKWRRGGSVGGLLVADHLAGQGIQGVPAPLRSSSGGLWSDCAGGRISIVTWAPGRRALDGTMTLEHWTTFGRLVASIHSVVVPQRIQALLPLEPGSHDSIAQVVRDVGQRLAVSGRSAGPLVAGLGGLWEAASVERLLVATDRLARHLDDDPAPAVLCHGDAHLGNVQVGDAARVWLLDWDDAVLAPRERDLLFVEHGVLAFAPVSAEQTAAFYRGYGDLAVDPKRLAYHRAVRALDDLGSWSADVLDAAQPAADRARALEIVTGLWSASGLVRVALDSARAALGDGR